MEFYLNLYSEVNEFPSTYFDRLESFSHSDEKNECLESIDSSLVMDTGTILQLSIPGCKLTCNKIKSELATCTNTKGNRMVTNSLYFIFRMLATMCLACNFVLLHAQTIQMCKIEEEQGNTGALGRQYVYEALAQAIISPSGITKVEKILKGSLDLISSLSS